MIPVLCPWFLGGLAYEDIIGYMGDGWGWDYSDGHEDPTAVFSSHQTLHFASLALAAGEQGCPIRQNQSVGMNWRVLWMKQTRQYASYEMNLRKFNDVWIDVRLNQMCRFYTHVISFISTLLKSLHDIHAFHTPVIRVKWASCHRGRSSKQNYPSGIL